MTTATHATTLFIKALESAFKLDSADCHPNERLSIYVADDLVYGKNDTGAIDKLDDKLVALLSGVAIDELPPPELALYKEILFPSIDIRKDGTSVLSYVDGNYTEKALLDQLLADDQLQDIFATVRDEAIAVVDVDATLPNPQFYFDTELQPEVISATNCEEVVEPLVQVQILPETEVFVETQVETQVESQVETETQVEQLQLVGVEQLVTNIDEPVQLDVVVLDSEEELLSEKGEEVQENNNEIHIEYVTVAASAADDMGVNSGASRMFVAAAETDLSIALAQTGDRSGNEAVDVAMMNVIRAKDANWQVDATLRERQSHKVMVAAVAIAVGSGKNEIKTKGGEYIVKVGSDGSALLASSAGVIYDGLPNIGQASINLMSDADINSLRKSVQHTVAYAREAEKDKQSQMEL